MRIALVAPLVTPIAQPFVGGAQAMIADLAQGLVERGHDVTMFAREGSLIPGIRIEYIAVPATVVPANFSDTEKTDVVDDGFIAQCNLFFAFFLQLRQRAAEFDIVHAHAFDWPAFACSTLLTPAIPMVHTVHLPAVSEAINDALRILEQQGHPLTLVTVSQACAQDYAAYTSFDHVIYNGLDIAQIPFGEVVASDAPLLYAGRITPEKGLIDAIRIARHAGRHLLIAGGIYDQAYYETRILPELQAASQQVTYLGQLDHATLWKLMGQVSGLLFPIAWDEPFGLTPCEAMAAGTPVLAFRRGAVAEIIRDGETGFLVDPGDCERAAALVPCLATLSRAECRAHIARNFSRQHTLAAYERVYASLIQAN
ncbi:MAG TPA: glycosyltransferase [Dictyobacter sp.]|jgi:glycosyltransferase involved in cell wall biosynthesis|nr:glycosyltransferase [Dictyobacter sp.]